MLNSLRSSFLRGSVLVVLVHRAAALEYIVVDPLDLHRFGLLDPDPKKKHIRIPEILKMRSNKAIGVQFTFFR